MIFDVGRLHADLQAFTEKFVCERCSQTNNSGVRLGNACEVISELPYIWTYRYCTLVQLWCLYWISYALIQARDLPLHEGQEKVRILPRGEGLAWDS